MSDTAPPLSPVPRPERVAPRRPFDRTRRLGAGARILALSLTPVLLSAALGGCGSGPSSTRSSAAS